MSGGVIVSQLGARMHYGVPRTLAAAGRLDHLYTDICGTQGWPRFLHAIPEALQPRALRRLIGRRPAGVPPEKLSTFPAIGLRYALARARARTRSDETRAAVDAGWRLSTAVIRRGFGDAGIVFGYSGECLELLLAARAAGLATVVEQTIAPREIVDTLLGEEVAAFPQWQPRPEADRYAAMYAERERAEWAEADLILCGSDFVRRGVIERGGPGERCEVVPYGVDGRFRRAASRQRFGSLRVLTVGEVGLRKGSPYVLDVARRMTGLARFRMVGAHPVGSAALAELHQAVELTGAVPRSEMTRHFAWADVFLLPSLCEGSATVVYEALAAGLPVVCTANTGSVVRQGVDGFIVPVRNVDRMVEHLTALAEDPALCLRMSADALSRAEDFTLDRYGERLLAALAPLLSSNNAPHLPPQPTPHPSDMDAP